jgi:hypothetical protein
MILALSAVALLQDTPDLANRLTIVLSLNQYMGQELEAKVVEVEEAPLAAPPRASLASMMGLADTPKPIIEINLERTEFSLDQFITVQGVERIWLWLKNRHTKENAMQMVAIFQERLVVIDRLLREQHAKQRY